VVLANTASSAATTGRGRGSLCRRSWPATTCPPTSATRSSGCYNWRMKRNQVVCAECGKVRLETPPGTTILPTIGMAKKAAGLAGSCGCGRRPGERPPLIRADDEDR
jgi:hypothetical protein